MAEQGKQYTVEELLELAHKHRALHIKVGPLEVQLSPAAFADALPSSAPPKDFQKMPTLEEFQFLHAAQLGPEEEAEEKPGAKG